MPGTLNWSKIVLSNAAYGIIHRLQIERHGHEVGTGLRNPDFVQLARACGAHGMRAEGPEQPYKALIAAWGYDVPVVIEVPAG